MRATLAPFGHDRAPTGRQVCAGIEVDVGQFGADGAGRRQARSGSSTSYRPWRRIRLSCDASRGITMIYRLARVSAVLAMGVLIAWPSIGAAQQASAVGQLDRKSTPLHSSH